MWNIFISLKMLVKPIENAAANNDGNTILTALTKFL